MRSCTHVMDVITPRILEALEITRKSNDRSVEITIQIRDDSPNAKISQNGNEEILVDLGSGVRRSPKGLTTKTDPSAILDVIQNLIEDRLFSSKVKGTAELKLCFKNGSFTKVEEHHNERSIFAKAAAQKTAEHKSKISDWVNK